MSDDLLATVKAALHNHANGACVCEHEPGLTIQCVIGALHPNGSVDNWLRALVARCEQAEAEVERMKLVVMAHKTWENEAVAQAGNANLALNKIRTENSALCTRHAAAVEQAYKEGIGYILSKVWEVERIHAAWLASEAKAALEKP